MLFPQARKSKDSLFRGLKKNINCFLGVMVIGFVEKLEKSRKHRCHKAFRLFFSVTFLMERDAETGFGFVEKMQAQNDCGFS